MRVTEPFVIVDQALTFSQLLDTLAHSPSTDATTVFFHDVHEFRGFAIRLRSTLDQPVILTVFGNFTRSETGADDYPDRLTLGDGSTTTQYGIIAFHMARSGWTPWIYCSLQCPVAPTSGAVLADIIKFDPMED